MEPYEHIQQIRKEKFKLNEYGRLTETSELMRDLHNSITQLSEGLYSEDVHFILELIQNAEDNSYRENIKPDLVFRLLPESPVWARESDGCLLIVNNESGFSEEDVKFLCSVGGTKKTKREGYIGEKGIGFKSVFQVTMAPHIFSNGYQFHFKENDTEVGLGYIVPYWVDEMPSVLKQDANKTQILLPLKPGKRNEISLKMAEIAPKTILFLRKLEGLIIEDIEKGSVLKILRDSQRAPLVYLQAGDKLSKYWMTTKTFCRPPEITEEKRNGIDERAVTVALPLSEYIIAQIIALLFSGKIFAFLPTQVYSGLPFLVNADFLVPAGRETIQFNKDWNKWLRDCIAPTFVEAFVTLIQSNEYRFEACRFIPLKRDIRRNEDFFNPIVEAIHTQLKSMEVIWPDKGDKPVKPSDARRASQEFRKLFARDSSPSFLTKVHLVHKNLEKYREQSGAIGVRALTTSEQLECLRDEEWLSSRSMEWFIELYKYLASQGINKEKLRELKIIPIEGKGLVAGKEGTVYLGTAETPYVFKDLGIFFLNQEITANLEADADLQKFVVENLQIIPFSISEFIVRTLIPFLETNRRENPEIITYTKFIRDYWKVLSLEQQVEVRRRIPLLLKDGRVLSQQKIKELEQQLILPENDDMENGWQLIFCEPEDRENLAVISEHYLKMDDKEDTEKWIDFFRELGANDCPNPRRVFIYSGYLLDEYQKKEFERAKKFRCELYYGRDYHEKRFIKYEGWIAPKWMNDFDSLNLDANKITAKCEALLHWLDNKFFYYDDEWNDEYYLKCYGRQGGYHSSSTHKVPSRLKHFLKTASWFPSTQGLKPPNEVFLDKEEIREVLQDTVPYATVTPLDKVCRFLRIRDRATTQQILDYLESLSIKEEKVELTRITRLYRFLSSRDDVQIREAFSQKRLIYLPDREPSWVGIEDVIWSDLSKVFGDAFAYLEPIYGNKLQSFFVDQLQIKRNVDVEDYARAWQRLSESSQLEPQKVETALTQIYRELLPITTDLPESLFKPKWWDDFVGKAKIWTQNKSFKEPAKVFVPDDGELRQIFRAKNVEFVWRPEHASFADFMPLYQAIGAKVLSEEVNIRLEGVETGNPLERPRMLTIAAKRLIFHKLWNEDKDNLLKLKDKDLIQALLRTQEIECETLSLVYSLNSSIQVPVDDKSVYWDINEEYLYLRTNSKVEDVKDELASLLAMRLFQRIGRRDFENFLLARAIGISDDRAEKLIRKYSWSIPHDEQEWLNNLLTFTELSLETDSKEQEESESDRVKEISRSEDEPEEKRREIDDDTSLGKEPYLPPHKPLKTIIDGGIITNPEPAYVSPTPDENGPSIEREPTTEADSPLHQRGESEKQIPRIAPLDIEALGIARVLEYEKDQDRNPRDVRNEKLGYDVISQCEGKSKYIEVKAFSAEPSSISSITVREWSTAVEKGDDYYLYVVTNLQQQKSKIYIIQNPYKELHEPHKEERIFYEIKKWREAFKNIQVVELE